MFSNLLQHIPDGQVVGAAILAGAAADAGRSLHCTALVAANGPILQIITAVIAFQNEQGRNLDANGTGGAVITAAAELGAQSVPDLQAVVVDYLGLLLPSTPTASTYERISAISRELKRIALQLKVPVICLSQLSRGVESREDKRPRLSDLRDSGAIEQDADSVLFLYRDDYYRPEIDTGGSSVVELSVAKNRHGSLGKVEMLAFLHCSYFRERVANG